MTGGFSAGARGRRGDGPHQQDPRSRRRGRAHVETKPQRGEQGGRDEQGGSKAQAPRLRDRGHPESLRSRRPPPAASPRPVSEAARCSPLHDQVPRPQARITSTATGSVQVQETDTSRGRKGTI